MQAGSGQVATELRDPGFVADRRPGVRAGGGWLVGVLAADAVDLVELLGPVVVRGEVGVGDRPGGGDAVHVPDGAEVPLAEAVEDRAEELGVAADVVVLLGGELPAVGPVGPLPA